MIDTETLINDKKLLLEQIKLLKNKIKFLENDNMIYQEALVAEINKSESLTHQIRELEAQIQNGHDR